MKALTRDVLRIEVFVRLCLIAFFFYTDKAPGFRRTIQKEEFWLYSFPRAESYYPSSYLWTTVFCTPLFTAAVVYRFNKDKVDAVQFILGVFLAIFLAGDITNCLKLGVGRPRPDFLARCFPDGKIQESMECTGTVKDVIEGYKSFPSGHSSLCFGCLGFIALYLAGKLHIFNPAGRGQAWPVLIVVFPLLWATMIAVSRTADYHHHWQDVTVGSIIGLSMAYLSYRMYYPALQRVNSHLPYVLLKPSETQILYHDHIITTQRSLEAVSPTAAIDLEHAMKLAS